MTQSGRIFLLHTNKELAPLDETEYDSEDLLQTIVTKHPDLLGGEQINPDSPRRFLLVAREMTVHDDTGAGRWSLDHLFLDQDGIPTLVEVKRSSDSRIRREVVGQMLDYAANSTVHWPVGWVRSQFEEGCRRNGENASSKLQDFLGLASEADESDVDHFWDAVESNLRDKRIRLLFVADTIPTELRRIIEFLNEVMTPTEALAVEIHQFTGEGVRVLVPRVTGQTEARRHAKQLPQTRPPRVAMEEETFLDAVRDHADRDDNVLQAVPEILAWSRKADLDLTFETTTRGPQCLIRLPGSVALLQMEDSARATWLCMTALRRRAPFDREEVRDSLREKLVGIPGFSLSRAGMTGWPRINLSELVRGGRLTEFIRVMDWMVDQWRSNQQSGP